MPEPSASREPSGLASSGPEWSDLGSSGSSHSESPGPGPRAGLLLGLSMGVGNALSYAFVLVLTRALGPSSFGAYSALSTIGIVLAIPAGAFQVIIARRWSDADSRTSGVIAAAGSGLALTVVTAASAPVLRDVLHLGALGPTIAMSLMLVPMTVTGAFQGMLLGAGRLTALSALYIVTAGTRLVAAALCASLGADVTEVFAAMAVASLFAALWGWWLCRDLLTRTRAHSPSLLAEMLRSNSTLAAFTALTNVDVVLVRHFLDAHTSGGYGLASTFGRAMCWGTQFVALLIVPRMAKGASGPKGAGATLWRAAGFIVGIGAVAMAVAAIDPELLVRLVGGPAYSGFGGLVVACLALGTLWALAQLWLFSQMAGNDATLGYVAWAAVAVEIALGWGWCHGSAAAIIILSASCAGVVVLVGAWRTHTHRVTALESEDVLLVTDRT